MKGFQHYNAPWRIIVSRWQSFSLNTGPKVVEMTHRPVATAYAVGSPGLYGFGEVAVGAYCGFGERIAFGKECGDGR